MSDDEPNHMTPYDTLILDLEAAVRDFKWYLKDEDKKPEFVNDIIHTIISVITDIDSAEYELRNFMNEIAYAEGIYNDGEVKIDQSYSMAVFDLSKIILQQLIDLKAFDEVGELMYEYSGYEHPEFKGGVLLKRVK